MKFQHLLSGSRMAVRLSVWFFLLSLLPISVVFIIGNQNIQDSLANFIAAEESKSIEDLVANIELQGEQQALQAAMKNLHTPGQGIFIINEQGIYAFHSSEGKVGQPVSGDFSSQAVTQLLGSTKGSLVDTHCNCVVVYKTNPVHNEVVVATYPLAEVQTYIDRAARVTLQQLIVSLVFMGIAGGLMVWLILGLPLRHFSKAAEDIASGKLGTRVDPDEMDDELKSLSRNFNQMSSEMESLVSGLENNLQEVSSAKQAYQESEMRFRAILSNISEAIALLDANGSIRYISPPAERIYGWKAEERVGKLPTELVHPDDIPRMQKEMQELIQNPHVTASGEFRLHCADGSWRWVEGRLHNALDVPGLHSMVLMFRDNTEAHEAKERERLRQDYMSSVLELGKTVTRINNFVDCLKAIHKGVQKGLGFDRVGILLYSENAQTIVGAIGTDPQGNICDNSHVFLNIEEVTIMREILTKETGYVYTPDFSTKFGEGQGRDMHGVGEHIAVAAWAGDKPVAVIVADNLINRTPFSEMQLEALRLFAGYAGLAIDGARLHEELERRVRERTRELEEANAELESFTYSISHDLRSPLRAVKGYSQILLRQYSTQVDENGKAYLNNIVQASHRMAQLTDDLLSFARLNKQALRKQWVEPYNLVQGVFDELKPEYENRVVHFQIGYLPPCYADPSLLRQIYVNLIGNALKYSRDCEQSWIEVGSNEKPGDVVYYVKDNGVGFDMQHANKLFEVFQRLHSEAEFEGTGVGLAIVQRIVTRHGGRVWAEGKVNEGATFYFSLAPYAPLENSNNSLIEK